MARFPHTLHSRSPGLQKPRDREYKVFDIDAWLAAFAGIARKNEPVVLICRTGNRTESVAGLVDQAGYRRVYTVTKGIAQGIGEGPRPSRIRANDAAQGVRSNAWAASRTFPAGTCHFV
ncbi:rhodanese-like domain-containing protein [Aromatoleum bremense]|uniref:rhodanese-like domain-containing protein n=1 Tax=Aromatoleum bremense TaxID=76115 RepID=UPI0031400A3F